jgi:hypothetical protein
MDTSTGDAIGFKAGDTGGANVPTLGRFFVGGLDGGDGFMDEVSINKKVESFQFFMSDHVRIRVHLETLFNIV